MSKQDEFEDLIKDFKLDDINAGRQPEQPRESVRRKAFNFEEDAARRGASQQQPVRQPARAAAPAAPRRAPAALEQRRAEKRLQTFQVNIRDEAFYEPSTESAPPAPPRGGGGGGNGGGGNGAGRWFKALIALAVLLAISVFLAFFALQSASDMFGINKPDTQIEVTLPEHLSMTQIAGLLKEQGVIMQPFTFQVYAGLKNKSDDFIPGTYLLNSNMSYDQILIIFKTHSIPLVEVTVMFPEGSSLREIAEKLEESDVCKAKNLYEYLEKGEFSYDYSFMDKVPDDENRFRKYEGYFFPDTYKFYKDENVDTVVQKFFRRFEEKVVTDDVDKLLMENNMTLDQAVTLASMVQKEAGKVEDMKNVSAVFHKRLLNPNVLPTLGSDVTIFYVENDIKPFLNVANQKMFDAYNTYKCVGLPAGPICNPGMDALTAVLKYTPTDNYYFLADKNGKFYYARTLDEHNANIRAAGIEGIHGLDVPEN